MATRRELLRALACLPLAAAGARALEDGGAAPALGPERAWTGADQRGRGLACALGEDADASALPPPRRQGEHLALALAGTPAPPADALPRLLGAGACAWVELSAADRGSVDDGPLAERIRTAASVALVEGSVLEWLVTLYPARRSSAVLRALAECAATGGRVVGRGSTAFLVAGGGVVLGATRDGPGESRLRLANPREDGEARLALGLGLCGEQVVDTHARSGGSLLRLLSTLVESHLDEGVLLAPRSALCCDLETRGWTALGADPLLHVDLRGSRRESRSVRGARLSTLARGDGRRRLERGLFASGAPAEFAPARAEAAADDALAAALLAAAPRESAAWRDPRVAVVLRRTGGSRALSGPDGGPDGGAVRGHALALDVTLASGRFGELAG